MKTMTFQARELKEALAQVRQRLGPDALIISTRQVTPMLGLKGPLLEVTAALPDSAPQAPAAPEELAPSGAAEPPARESAVQRLLNRATLRYRAAEQAGRDAGPVSEPAAPPAPEPNLPNLIEKEAEAEAALEARLQPLRREVSALRSQLYQVAQGASPALKQEVEELRQVLRTMGREAQKSGDILPQVAHLINLGIERPCAEALVKRAREIAGDYPAALVKAVSERVAVAGPVGVSARVAAFIGPTGVGKTTTIAKIAARAALIDGAKVALITVDTFRVGAIDQLQRYADLMELPLLVAGTSVALKSAVTASAGADLILVDTAGRGPRDVAQIAALRGLLGGAESVEVHLCLAATTRTREQALALQSYRALSPSRLCVTKLDEAITLGEVLNLHETSRLPLSYFGIGQKVPEDLELCTAEGFARRLLGIREAQASRAAQPDRVQKGASP